MNKGKKIWHLWTHAIEDSVVEPRYRNIVAIIRTLIFVNFLIVNIATVVNIVHHW